MVVGSRSPSGYLEKNKIVSAMALGSRSPGGSESPGILEE